MSIWKEIKYALNTSLGKDTFIPLDEMMARMTGYYTEQTTYIFETPGNYEVIIPYNCKRIKVTACGGGGGGNVGQKYTDSDGESVRSGGNGGGGGASIIDTIFDVTPITHLPITIGAGGIGGDNTGDSYIKAEDGGATVIGTIVTLNGGKAGGRESGTGGSAGGTGGGAGGTGAIYKSTGNVEATTGKDGLTGAGGTVGAIYNNTFPGGGGGGSLGNGGNGAYYVQGTGATTPTDGVRGGGGGGEITGSATSGHEGVAGNGGDGYCKIELILS